MGSLRHGFRLLYTEVSPARTAEVRRKPRNLSFIIFTWFLKKTLKIWRRLKVLPNQWWRQISSDLDFKMSLIGFFKLTNTFSCLFFRIRNYGVTRFPPSNCDLYLPAKNTINLEIKKPLISNWVIYKCRLDVCVADCQPTHFVLKSTLTMRETFPNFSWNKRRCMRCQDGKHSAYSPLLSWTRQRSRDMRFLGGLIWSWRPSKDQFLNRCETSFGVNGATVVEAVRGCLEKPNPWRRQK